MYPTDVKAKRDRRNASPGISNKNTDNTAADM